MAEQTRQIRIGKRSITPAALAAMVDRLLECDGARYRRLWAYYRNALLVSAPVGDSAAQRPYRQSQEWGLPSRITGELHPADIAGAPRPAGIARKEVVIENDIGWRIDTLVDYLFGKPLVIRSAAPQPHRRALLDGLIRAILAHNGGLLFLQQLALLGSVYGFVDVLVKLDPAAPGPEDHAASCCTRQNLGQPPIDSAHPHRPRGEAGGEGPADLPLPPDAEPAPPDRAGEPDEAGRRQPASLESSTDTGAGHAPLEAQLARLARLVRLEIVEPARALPLLCPDDWRIVEAYAQCCRTDKPAAGALQSAEKGRWWERLFCSTARGPRPGGEPSSLVIELITPDRWQRFRDGVLVAQGVNSLGMVPLVHIQNAAVPFEYAGTSDVEPLIPLQDELNTRLSDRANRIALQSFKMYLGKGIEHFNDLPVAPGRMWMTDNQDAEVQEFGGDADCPSESLHIQDVREAMDKISGVSPIAAGAIKNRIGRLTSAAALRVTLISLLARTEKKRTTYGLGLARMIELALAWLDRAGLFHTDPGERQVELHWPSPLPENQLEKLQEAEAKARLGVPKEVVLKELGY